MRIHYDIADLTGDDHRAGTFDIWQTQGLFDAGDFTPPLTEGHDYTVRVAVELYGGGLSPWSAAKPISAIEQAITGFWLHDNGATVYLGWSLADPSVAPPLDLQLRVDGGDWLDLLNPGETSYCLLDPRQFHALTGNAQGNRAMWGVDKRWGNRVRGKEPPLWRCPCYLAYSTLARISRICPIPAA